MNRASLARIEVGSVEGIFLEAKKHSGHPAFMIRERLSNVDVPCIMSADIAKIFGPETSVDDVWNNLRILVSGQIAYRADGTILQIQANHFERIDPRPVRYRDFADPNFTAGLNPRDHIELVWGDNGG